MQVPVKKRIMLKPEFILRFLISQDEQLDNLIIFHSDKYEIVVTDASLYKALGSIKEYDSFQRAKLVKLLEAVTIIPQKKQILTHEEVSRLRQLALNKKETR